MTWNDAMAIANGKAVVTGRRHWVWRGRSGKWWVTTLDAPLEPLVVEACS